MSQECRGSDFVFTVPDDWVERSMIGYSAPPSPERPMTPNILIAVNHIPADEELGGFVNRQIEDLGRRAAGFTLSLRRDARLDGAECVEIVFHWQGGDQGTIKQRQVYARRPGNRVVSVTHTAREQDFADCDGLFLDMLRNFVWTEPSTQ
jgi:hypothetical protein